MIVRSVNGEEVDRKLCRKYKDGFYIIGKDCVQINGRYYKVIPGRIIFDNETGEWIINSAFINLATGIIGFKDDDHILGKFTRNKAKNVLVTDENGRTNLCISRDIIPENYVERLATGEILHKDYFNRRFESNEIYVGNNYSVELDYKASYRFNEFTESFKKYFKGDILLYENTELERNYEVLNDITIGIEYETSNGFIPEDLCLRNGMIPVKDGSLRRKNYLPFEYATVILNGKTGLKAINEQCKLLTKYCEKSNQESMHVHIGNIPVDKQYVTAMYMTGYQLQNEIFSMFPLWYETTSKFKKGGKDYCKKLSKLQFSDDSESNFQTIYSWLVAGYGTRFNGFGNPHPADRFGNAKWGIKRRYYFLNLIPTVFSQQETVEWRIHNPTFNPNKIVNWIYILNAITQYVYRNRDEISSLKLDISGLKLKDIINDIYCSHEEVRDYISAYITYRKSVIKKCNANEDYIGDYDIENDNMPGFNYKVKSLIR